MISGHSKSNAIFENADVRCKSITCKFEVMGLFAYIVTNLGSL